MLHDDVLLHLSLIKGVGPGLVERVREYSGLTDFSQLYLYSVADFVALGFSESSATLLVDGLKDTKLLDHERSLLTKYGISWISYDDERYPALLKEIHLPPVGLYMRGSLELKQALAVVGSRNANFYGQRVIDMLIPPLVQQGWTIVSGGAVGADTWAHRATIKAGGKTIVVLGSGLLKPYPATNSRLFHDIVEAGGAIISSFSLETGPHPGNFPARNRIISGLSQGCLVVQAAQESGACITARCALEQGREVFAVPGPIDDVLSAGCHDLIKQGAQIVTSVQDIVEAFSFTTHHSVMPAMVTDAAMVQEPDSLAGRIVQLCREPRTIDELVELLQLDVCTVQEHLVDLQLQGKVSSTLAGHWHML